MPNSAKQWGILILFIVLCQGAGIIGTFVTFDAIPTWYATLVRPSFSPPNWIFGPVWTTLYTLMGVSAYLVWAKRGLPPTKATIRTKGLWIFWVHLFFNALWSLLFFGLQSPLLALVDIAVLWVLLVASMFYFFRISKTAGALLVPYLVWISFASVLNAAILLLN